MDSFCFQKITIGIKFNSILGIVGVYDHYISLDGAALGERESFLMRGMTVFFLSLNKTTK